MNRTFCKQLTGLVGEYAGEVGAVIDGRDMFSLVRGSSTNNIICMSESSSDYDDSISHMMTANDKVFNYTLTVGW